MRGSTPCPCDANRRYGGNTSCVALEAPGHAPIVLDLGTGLRFWGETLDPREPFTGSALVTHIHWDHVQGLPFFTPILQPGARFDVYGPPQPEAGGLGEAFGEFMRPPFFPVTTKELLGDIRFHDVWDAEFELDGAKICARPVPHVGLTSGYRVEMGGAVVAYISDHQMPVDGSHDVSDAVLSLCDGADLLIHDAQYTVDEFPAKSTGGTARRTSPCTWRRRPGCGGWRCSTTTPPTTTTSSTRSSSAPAPARTGPGSKRCSPPTRAWSSPSADPLGSAR